MMTSAIHTSDLTKRYGDDKPDAIIAIVLAFERRAISA